MNIEWLLDCKPRPVQEEALLRSYYGYKSRERRDDPPVFEKIREGVAVGWAHFLEMRLGKTPTLLNELALLEKYQGITRRYMLAPNNYKKAWTMETSRFGLLWPTHAFETSRIKDAFEFIEEFPDDHLIVFNYESMIYDEPKKLLMELLQKEGTFLGADESIRIKNHASIVGRTARELGVEADYVRILTGLPMTQGPGDLYNQIRFIRGLDGKNFYAFRNRYCLMGGFKGKKIIGVKDEDMLRRDVIEPRAFVAKRKDWGRVTEPEHYHMYLELSPVQQKHYAEMDEEMITMLESGDEVSVDQVISKLLKLQQISSGFVYNEYGDVVELMDPAKTPKAQAIIELLENEIDSKVILPYHYSATGDVFYKALERYNPAIIRSKGWMKKNNKDVEEEKKRFNEDPACRVILLQTQAGKYGHTLTGAEGDRCTHMLFIENTYSLDDRNQIEMRNTAETQDWTNVYLDFVSSPVEQNAVEALRKKEDIVTAVFGAYNPNKEIRVHE